MKQLTMADEDEEYRAFVEKFKPKKTTDDCYTPPEIFHVILDYVVERYGIDPGAVVRPFWPGGDYETEDYPAGCVVVDNPPFSILAKIATFYISRGIKFFLFSPTLTALGGRSHVLDVNHIICNASITYANGATVNTSFITNLDTDGTVIESCPELKRLIDAKNDELQKQNKRQVPKYAYPDNIVTAARVGYLASHDTPYKLHRDECVPIGKLDAMGQQGIFGGGLLLSSRAAAERAAAIRWQLSEREREIIAALDARQRT